MLTGMDARRTAAYTAFSLGPSDASFAVPLIIPVALDLALCTPTSAERSGPAPDAGSRCMAFFPLKLDLIVNYINRCGAEES